jgi:hypothetical protein
MAVIFTERPRAALTAPLRIRTERSAVSQLAHGRLNVIGNGAVRRARAMATRLVTAGRGRIGKPCRCIPLRPNSDDVYDDAIIANA